MSDRRLWAVTAYFNPCGYRTRLENFRIFRERLAVPLVAVELVYDGRPVLEAGDADILVQVEGHDVLWQKERLLNVALGALPDRCDAVAWLDCDLVFASPRWESSVLTALEAAPVIQAFHTVYDLPRGARPEDAAASVPELERVSLACAMADERLPLDIFSVQGASLRYRYSPGHAWAARRDLLRAHGLYDALVMGSGDKAMAAAAFGQFYRAACAFNLNEAQARHYLEWAIPFAESASGRVGFADEVVYHLWHGALGRRGYGDRYNGFDRFDFDPFKDIALADGGCWSWASDKPELHEHVRRHFTRRAEDGGG
jgi:hypothetical protein